MMKIEEFLNDAKKLIQISSSNIKEKMSEHEVISSITFFAFGIERLLHYILANINPCFVLQDKSTKNIALSFYEEKLKQGSEILKNSNKISPEEILNKTVTFRDATLLTGNFSTSIEENKRLIFNMISYRGIVAHRAISELNFLNANRLLAKDGYKLIADICKEFELDEKDFFGKNYESLRELSRKIYNETNFIEEMQRRLEEYKAVWEKKSVISKLVKQAEDTTNIILNEHSPYYHYEAFTCPACGKDAIAKIEPYYDDNPHEDEMGELIGGGAIGVLIESIKCYFCDLELSNYEELNYINANSILEPPLSN